MSNLSRIKKQEVIISSTIASAIGWLLFELIGDKRVHGVEKIGVDEVIFPVFMFSCFGIVAGAIGVLRNRYSLVEVNLNQIFPYAFAAFGYIVAHFMANGSAQLSDAGLVGVALMVTLFLIGSIKNAILLLHNKVIKRGGSA